MLSADVVASPLIVPEYGGHQLTEKSPPLDGVGIGPDHGDHPHYSHPSTPQHATKSDVGFSQPQFPRISIVREFHGLRVSLPANCIAREFHCPRIPLPQFAMVESASIPL